VALARGALIPALVRLLEELRFVCEPLSSTDELILNPGFLFFVSYEGSKIKSPLKDKE
jgi:hypothetical protein